ncbi:MAG: hypothetical protein QW101_04550 [Ignisphaera sp.]|uniref:30S ribosomal protein S25e n=1 Tax=Ignisphaera aggregans TaxID=334771 RepID=A0A7J3MYS2_9CREN
MGTKGGKPISSIEKKQKKVEKKVEKKEEKKEEKLGIVDQSMIKKIVEELKSQSHITTFQVAQKYNIRYSMAKKLLRAAVSQGVEIVAKNRRVIVVSLRK